jgi:hypothetical protein
MNASEARHETLNNIRRDYEVHDTSDEYDDNVKELIDMYENEIFVAMHYGLFEIEHDDEDGDYIRYNIMKKVEMYFICKNYKVKIHSFNNDFQPHIKIASISW